MHHLDRLCGCKQPTAMEKAASFLSSLVGGGGSPEPAATVRSITIYPLKSCRGISVPQASVTSTGTLPTRSELAWCPVSSCLHCH